MMASAEASKTSGGTSVLLATSNISSEPVPEKPKLTSRAVVPDADTDTDTDTDVDMHDDREHTLLSHEKQEQQSGQQEDKQPQQQQQQQQEEVDDDDEEEEEELCAARQRLARVMKEASEDGLQPRVLPDLSNVCVGRIVARFVNPHAQDEQSAELYLCLFKTMSYLHARRLTAAEVVQYGGPQGRRRLLDFVAKNTPLYDGKDTDVVCDDFTRVDRVLAVRDAVDGSGRLEVLVKWHSLPYSAATWEYTHDVSDCDASVKLFNERQTYNALQGDPVRPAPSQWSRLTESPKFKNNNVLREWQVEGVSWLQFCWYQHRGCILGDEMGLGKTVQVAALLRHMASVYNSGPFLVVAPLSTIGHWKRVLEDWTDLNVVVNSGSREDRELCRLYEWRYWTQEGDEVAGRLKFDVLIATYESVMADSTLLLPIRWRALVVDEGHRLKNHKSKLFKMLHSFSTEHRVLLTGTPVQNDVSELWTLLHFVCAEEFASMSAFMELYGALSSSAELERLQEQLGPYLLRRLKEDVAKFLPPKRETIVEIELTQIQKQYYRAVLESNREFLNKGCDATAAPKLVNIGMQLRKCCNHPYLISGARERITNGLHTSEELCDALVRSSGKFVFVDKLLPRLIQAGRKTLIFSQFKLVLNVLSLYLESRGFGYERLDGDVRGAERQASIDRFCAPDSTSHVFLLSTRAGGLGLNLQIASTVIIFDSDWNPQADIQAQARAHRLGQTQDVTVYRLITRRTYEQHMFECASRKLGLDAALLRGTGAETSRAGGKRGKGGTRAFKREIEQLLRRGVYDVFTAEADAASKKFCDDDIDTILEERTVRQGEAEEKPQQQQQQQQALSEAESGGGRRPSTFSKARFTSAAADADVDLNAPDFWQRFLPDRHSAAHMQRELDDAAETLREPDQCRDFMQRLAEAVGRAEALGNAYAASQQLPLLDLLARAADARATLGDQAIDTIAQWRSDLENPRRKRRKTALDAEKRQRLARERADDDAVAAAIDAGDDVDNAAAVDAAAAADDDDDDAARGSTGARRPSRRSRVLPLNAFGSPSAGRPEVRALREAALVLGSSWATHDTLWQEAGARVRPSLRYPRSDDEIAAFVLAFLSLCAATAAAASDATSRAVFANRRATLCTIGSLSPRSIAASSVELPSLQEPALQQHVRCHWRRWARLFALGRDVATCLDRYERADAELVIPTEGRHVKHQAAEWWTSTHDRSLLLGVRRYGVVQASLVPMFTDPQLAFAATLASLPAHAHNELPHLRAVELRLRALVIALGRSDSHPLIDGCEQATAAAEGAKDAADFDDAAAVLAVAGADADAAAAGPSGESEKHCGSEWSKRDRVWFQRGLLRYGPYRWEVLREKVGLQGKTVAALQHYFTQFKRLATSVVTKGAGSRGRHVSDAEAGARLRARHTYCVCESVAGGSGALCMCASCFNWFHSVCVGATDEATTAFTCPKCRVQASAPGSASVSASSLSVDMRRPPVAHPMPESQRSQALQLLEDLMQSDGAVAFCTAVDADASPAYFTVIQRPLDLGAVKAALLDDGYGRIDELAEDVRLVFRNCSQFNARASDADLTARRLAQQFETALKEREDGGAFLTRHDPAAAAAAAVSEIDPEMEVSGKMALKLVERLESFEKARMCVALGHDELVRRLEKASARWMPKWWRPTHHDALMIEGALVSGFAVEPEGFLQTPADPDARAFVTEFFADRNTYIRRFRYAVYFVLHGIDPNCKAARVRREQGLPPLPPPSDADAAAAATLKNRKRRRRTA